MSSRRQAQWVVPQGTFKTGLTVSNSLTNRKDEFVPSEGKHVKWYICGPTVYDSSHLGHARTYLSFDIIRRILEDYFGYDVQVCMNITDIDDKIIIRARKNYLFDEYAKKVTAKETVGQAEHTEFETAVKEFVDALERKHAAIDAAIKGGKRNVKEATPELNLAKEKLDAAYALQKRLGGAISTITTGTLAQPWLKDLKDALCDYLDQRFGKSLPTEVLNRITKEHSMFYEAEYLADMKALGIKTPDTLTRVTEYVPEVVEMCERIVANGFAYVSEGSVYFDVAAFDKAQSHHYAKLVPTAYGNTELLEEGEGGLSTGANEKRSRNDFALWKNSKPGEPVWDSPWGLGRPGWHIECSAMAAKVLGKSMDIHAGGCDLKFPHHDNELAQSEAYFDNEQWVNYFLHTGHLHIDNLKMSKSLKNFITIREMLAQHSARHVRLLFLLQPWDSSMNFQRVDTMKEVLTKEKAMREMFLRTEQVLGERTMSGGTGIEHWNERDTELSENIKAYQAGVHSALCDNFDTPNAMRCLMELVTKANSYMEKNTEKKAFLLKKAAVFVTRIMRVFGVVVGNQEIGFDPISSEPSFTATLGSNPVQITAPYIQAAKDFALAIQTIVADNPLSTLISDFLTATLPSLTPSATGSSSNGSPASVYTSAHPRDVARPIVSALVEFRKAIRAASKSIEGPLKLQLLQATDKIRDETMPKLDVRISDDGEFAYLFQDCFELALERQERIAAEESQRKSKLAGNIARKEKELQKWKEAAEAPSQAVLRLYKISIDSADAKLPETDSEGKQLSKSAAKDIKKLFTKQDTAHKQYLAQIATNPELVSKLEAEVADLKVQLGN